MLSIQTTIMLTHLRIIGHHDCTKLENFLKQNLQYFSFPKYEVLSLNTQ